MKSDKDFYKMIVDMYSKRIDELERYIKENPRLIQLEIYDKATNSSHVIGTDPHDYLFVRGGKVVYYNLQNGEGSDFGGDYVFVDKEML